MAIRHQLRTFFSGDEDSDYNICQMKIKKQTSGKIVIEIFRHTISIILNNDLTFSVMSLDKEMIPIVECTNKKCKEKGTSLLDVLECIDTAYSEKYLLTPGTQKEIDDEVFDGVDEEDGEDEDGFDGFDEDDLPTAVELDDFDQKDDLFISPTTQMSIEKQKEVLRKAYDEMFEKTQKNLQIGDIVGKMRSVASKDWKTKKAEYELYIEFYLDGFLVNRKEPLLKLSDPKNKKMMEELQKGHVPNELNPKGCVEIDVHVIWKDVKYEDRNNEEKLHHGLSHGMQKYEDDDVDAIVGEWFCGKCSMKNSGKVRQCVACGTNKPKFGVDLDIYDIFYECPNCTTKNTPENCVCAICGEKRPQSTTNSLPTTSTVSTTNDNNNNNNINQKNEDGGDDFWSCLQCTFNNSEGNMKCSVCGADKPKNASSRPSLFATKEWICAQCTFRNEPGTTVCQICGGVEKQTTTTTTTTQQQQQQLHGRYERNGKEEEQNNSKANTNTNPKKETKKEEEEKEKKKKKEEGKGGRNRGLVFGGGGGNDFTSFHHDDDENENEKKKEEEYKPQPNIKPHKKEEEKEEKEKGHKLSSNNSSENEGNYFMGKKVEDYQCDMNQPNTRIRIRFEKESVVQNFNLSDKVQKIADFVSSRFGMEGKKFEMTTGFPKMNLSEKWNTTVEENGLKNVQVFVSLL